MHCTGAGSTLENPEFHALIRLPRAGVFFVVIHHDNACGAELGRTDQFAGSGYASSDDECPTRYLNVQPETLCCMELSQVALKQVYQAYPRNRAVTRTLG